MGVKRYNVSNVLMLGATFTLASSIACAEQSGEPKVGTQGATIVVAGNADKAANAAAPVDVTSFPSSQAGVRRAAQEGPESLRRYIQRTRTIYNYYYWNFAKGQ
ncbi:MAG TPA: hypothetical protein VGJ08_00070 [Rhizomicrobium sp.]|jgi:hypothetical protein